MHSALLSRRSFREPLTLFATTRDHDQVFRRINNGTFGFAMRSLLNPYWWTFGLASLVQLVLFLRWLYRRIRNEELMRAFVKDMATNHLPHIYNLLEKICDQQGIERRKPAPAIRWVDLNHHRRH